MAAANATRPSLAVRRQPACDLILGLKRGTITAAIHAWLRVVASVAGHTSPEAGGFWETARL